MKKTFITLGFLSFSCFILAQNSIYTDSLAKKYDHNTIFLRYSTFEKDGQKYPYGLFKAGLKNELKTSPMAMREFKRSQTNRWLAIGSGVVGSILMIKSIDSGSFKKDFFYAGYGLTLLSIPFNITANNQLNRAAWLYNRDAIVRR